MSLMYIPCPYCGHNFSFDSKLVQDDQTVFLNCPSCNENFCIQIGTPAPYQSIDLMLDPNRAFTAAVDDPDIGEQMLEMIQKADVLELQEKSFESENISEALSTSDLDSKNIEEK